MAAYLSRAENRRKAKALLIQVSRAGCPPIVADQLFSNPLTGDPEQWLDENDLGPLLPFGCAAGDTAAKAAMARLIRAPGSHQKVAESAIGAMRKHPAARPLEAFIALAGAVRSIDAVAAVLAKVPDGDGSSLRPHSAALNELLRSGLRSRRATERSSAARLCVEILRLLLSMPGDMEDCHLRECFERESDPTTRAWLAVVLGELGGCDVSVDAALHSASIAPDLNLRNKALPAWIQFLRKTGTVSARALDVARAAATSPPDSGRLQRAGWLVDDLVPGYTNIAQRVLPLCQRRVRQRSPRNLCSKGGGLDLTRAETFSSPSPQF
jgi:hypothetical protein